MYTHFCRYLFSAVALLLVLTLGTGCAESDSSPPPTGLGEEGGEEEGGEESAPLQPDTEETNPDNNTDDGGESLAEDATDASSEPDITLVEVGCPDEQKSCTDKNGLNDPGLCADQPDTTCMDGCCVPIFKCQEDDDCSEFMGNADMGCPDERFDCACNETTGGCFLYVCNTNEDCSGDRVCLSGVCEQSPAIQKLRARVTSLGGVVTPTQSISLNAGAYDSSNNTQVVTGLDFEWNSSDGQIVGVDESGVVTGGEVLGVASVSVRVKGGESTWSDGVAISNVGAKTEEASLRVIAADERTSELLEGSVLIQTGGGNFQGTLTDGRIEFFDVEMPVDIHVFGATSHTVSIYGVSETDVIIHCPTPFQAELAIAKDETVDPDAQTFIGAGDILTGKLDYQNYRKEGEIELGITGMGVDQGLFAFNFGVLVGPDVNRYFDQELPAGLFDPNEEQELPGGVTFALGYPILSTYWLAATPGLQTVWSLAGRVGLNDSGVGSKISEIVATVDGGSNLEIGEIVATLLPLFETFYSGLSQATLEADPNYLEPLEQDNELTLPLSNAIVVTVPTLPMVGDGLWADTLLMMGGAMTDDRRFVPLGITAGTDIDGNHPEADGLVDGNPSTIGPDDFTLYMAPAHHQIQTDTVQPILVTVAAVLEEGENLPEAGSGIISTLDIPGAGPKPNSSLSLADTSFLPVVLNSSWNVGGSRIVSLPVADEGTDFRRVMFENADGWQWHVYLPVDVDTFALPDTALVEVPMPDYAGSASHYVVNAFDTKEGITLWTLATLGGKTLDSLLQTTLRASYVREKVIAE